MTPPDVLEALQAASETRYADAIVLICRLRPKVIEMIAQQTHAIRIAHGIFQRAGDANLVDRLSACGGQRVKPLASLTPREAEVLALIGRGYTNRAIAEDLVIAVSTAKLHAHHVMTKLGARSRLEAALMARDLLEKAETDG